MVQDRTSAFRSLWARLLLLGLALLALPVLGSVRGPDVPILVLASLGLLTLWLVPALAPARVSSGWRWGLDVAEALLLAALVARYGQWQSPFALLYVPFVADAAFRLAVRPYAVIAGLVALGYAGASLSGAAGGGPGGWGALYLPYWAPLVGAMGLSVLAAAGWLGLRARRDTDRLVLARRRLARYQELIGAMASPEGEEAFWRRFLRELARSGHFSEVAVVRWEGPRPEVFAFERAAAWDALVRRHAAVFRRRVLGQAQPEILVEQAAGRPARSIVWWPIPRRGEGAAGVICALAPRLVSRSEAARALTPWLGVAALALATSAPRMPLHKALIDWRTLVNVTLHRLHERLKPYLVLVNVEPGAVEGDALMLAEAIALAVEDAIDHAAPGAQVRLSVKRAAGGWDFTVEAAGPSRPAPTRTPQQTLAKQMVQAHGGAWHIETAEGGYRVGFLLPGQAEAAGG